MNEPDDLVWQRLSRALFGGRKASDEGLFTYRVMEEVRQLEPVMSDMAWHRFLRLAVPLLGVGMASLFLAARTPSSHGALLMENALFQKQSLHDDPLAVVLDGLR